MITFREGKGNSLGVIFDQIGTPTYARDLASAVFAAIRKGIIPGIYHFSNEGVCSWYDFTKSIHRIAGIGNCKVSFLIQMNIQQKLLGLTILYWIRQR